MLQASFILYVVLAEVVLACVNEIVQCSHCVIDDASQGKPKLLLQEQGVSKEAMKESSPPENGPS